MSEGKIALIDQWYGVTIQPLQNAAGESTQAGRLVDTTEKLPAWGGQARAIGRRQWAYVGAAAIAVLTISALPLFGDDVVYTEGLIESQPRLPVAEANPTEIRVGSDAKSKEALRPLPSQLSAGMTLQRPSLTDLVDDASSTWPVLGQRWNVRLSVEKPCDDALAQGLQCFRKPDTDLALLRLFDRPGLMQLRENDVTRFVQLEAMDDTTLTLSAGSTRWRMPVSELPEVWTGFYATLWRLPAGQTSRVFTAGAKDVAGQWLDQQLKQFQAKGELPPTEDSWGARLLAFQQQHKLYGDGKAVPSTFLLANRLAGVPEPRLSAEPDENRQ